MSLKGLQGHRVILIITLCLFVVCWMSGAKRPAKRGRAKKTTTDTKVYLQHANELTYDIYGKHPDAQFVKGNVAFLHKGTHRFRDSGNIFSRDFAEHRRFITFAQNIGGREMPSYPQ